jgi:hypothetical protein
MFALTLLEIVLLLPVLLALAWCTHRERNGLDSPLVSIPLLGFLGYWIYYMITAPAGEWFPPVFSKDFWTDAGTYWALGKYFSVGVIYSFLELLSGIIEEKAQIRARWNLLMEADDDLSAYVRGGAVEDVDDPKVLKLRKQIRDFCNNWGRSSSFVLLREHELERYPQPYPNFSVLKENLFAWIALWPGYLTSLLFGRFLDRIIAGINNIFRRIGTTIVRVLFRNTFSTKN